MIPLLKQRCYSHIKLITVNFVSPELCVFNKNSSSLSLDFTVNFCIHYIILTGLNAFRTEASLQKYFWDCIIGFLHKVSV